MGYGAPPAADQPAGLRPERAVGAATGLEQQKGEGVVLGKNPEVVCTELEDGAVLLNMETRLYYSLNETALEIWRLLGSAAGAEDVGRALAERYAVSVEDATVVAAGFLEQLERERLATPGTPVSGETPPSAAGPTGAPRAPFAEPDLVKHDEPLHEVAISPFDPQLPLAE